MLHKHSYSLWVPDGKREFDTIPDYYGSWYKTCPLGHIYCQVVPGYSLRKELPVGKYVSYETSANQDGAGHTHVLKVVEGVGDWEWIGRIGEGDPTHGHESCRLAVDITQWYLDLKESVVSTTGISGDPAGHHRHYYITLRAHPTLWNRGLLVDCPSAHTECKVTYPEEVKVFRVDTLEYLTGYEIETKPGPPERSLMQPEYLLLLQR